MIATDTVSHDVFLSDDLRTLLAEQGIGLSAYLAMLELQQAGKPVTIARLSVTLRRCYSEVREEVRDTRWFTVDLVPDLSTASLTLSALDLLRRAAAIQPKPTH